MEQYKGKIVNAGIAIGKIFHVEEKRKSYVKGQIVNVQKELERFETARIKAIQQLHALQEKALVQAGEESAMIFEVHAMLLEDEDYLSAINKLISDEKWNVEYAIEATGEKFSKLFSEMENEYMKARAADFLDISERLLTILSGNSGDGLQLREPSIIIAEKLTPSQTIQLDKSLVLAFVTKSGSVNSHTAILAKTMGIPALTGITMQAEWNHKEAVLDGYEGVLTIAPQKEYVEAMREKAQKDLEEKERLQGLKGKADVTKDGRSVKLYANIGSVSEIPQVLECDAAGIGLFRSEFLYLEKECFPTEDELFEAYKAVAEAMQGKKVIIRTLDIGADKQADYFHLPKEENPALGYRAIRICLKQPDMFITQLRAIYRASAYGNIAIMYPMIISVEEVRQIYVLAELVKKELSKEGICYTEIEHGIMIETPAAVMISDELAREVDFFSIGTNDLTQYTLAIDRQNEKLTEFYDAHHKAILKMIELVIENAHKAGIWVGICGELGADMSLLEPFLEMGIDELSVSPTVLLQIRDKIRSI